MIDRYVREEPWYLPGRANYEAMREFDMHNLRFQTTVNTAEDLVVAAEFTVSSITRYYEFTIQKSLLQAPCRWPSTIYSRTYKVRAYSSRSLHPGIQRTVIESAKSTSRV